MTNGPCTLVPTLRSSNQRYAADNHAPGDARRHVRARLTQWGLAAMIEHAEAVTSELVTNASLYGGGGDVTLRLELTREGVLVKVWDRNPEPPLVRYGPDPLLGLENGRGLVIVEALSARWGWFPEGPGKVVWSEITRAGIRLIGGKAAS